MKKQFRAPISTAIAISVGFIVLAGYFLEFDPIQNLRQILIRWAVILAGMAVIVGVINLLIVHWKKMSRGDTGGGYSAVTILSLLITVAVVGYFGPASESSLWIINHIQIPIESSLLAILAVVLIYMMVRLLRRNISLFSLIFVFTFVFIVLSNTTFWGIEVPFIHGPDGIGALIQRVPAIAGARGLLLGVALGSIATGLRILLGTDQPYAG
jgi:hypothetical protein